MTCDSPAMTFQNTSPLVTCDTLTMDPPHWITVNFTGTINGVPFARSIGYGEPPSDPHNARVNITDLTGASGQLHVVTQAHGDFGFGPVDSLTTDTTIQCHDPVTTTTTATTTTTVPVATTTTVAPTTTTSFAIEPTTTTTALTAPPKELPRTGSSDVLPATGFGILALGALLVWAVKARRS